MDALWDYINWVIDRILAGLGWVLDWVVDSASGLWAWLCDLVGGFFTFLWDAFWVYLNSTGWGSTFSSMNWLVEYVNDVSWILPVAPMLGLTVGALSACAAIRLLRWLKSFVPLISGA